MTTPFPLEEQAQLDGPTWNPWDGPTKPGFWSGSGFTENTAYAGPAYRLLEGAAKGAWKGEALLAGATHNLIAAPLANITEGMDLPGAGLARRFEQSEAQDVLQAQQHVKEMTPDAATTGTAAQILNGVGEGGMLASTGTLVGIAAAPASATAGLVGAATFTGASEGTSRYRELKEQGVGTDAAAAEGAVTAVASGAGVAMPGGFGSSLATRLMTGAVANTAFGMVNRYADHKILEAAGYPEMAEQQKALDGTQILVDMALGATFGGLAHLHANAEAEHVAANLKGNPDAQDAALAMNLGLADRKTAPGVPVDPASANAHQAAMEKATADMLRGKPVDVSDTGVDRATFAERPSLQDPEVAKALVSSLKESGILDEEQNLKDLEDVLAGKLGQKVETAAIRTRETSVPIREPGQPAASTPVADRLGDVLSRAGTRDAMESEGRGLLDSMTEAGTSPREVSDQFWKDTYWKLNAEGQQRFETYAKSLGSEPGAVLATDREGKPETARDWQHAGESLGENLPAKAEHLEGTQRGYVAMMKWANDKVSAQSQPSGHPLMQAIQQRPDLQMPSDSGRPVKAADALAQANDEATQGTQDATVGIQAAVNCFGRRGA